MASAVVAAETVQPGMAAPEDIASSWGDVPAHVLSYKTRKLVALYLDPDIHISRNWKDLADAMGFSYQFILNLERKDSPTEALLCEWMAKSESTIALLVQLLRSIKRDDAVTESHNSIAQDVDKYTKNNPGTLQNSSKPAEVLGPRCDIITKGDEETNTATHYDAFVSYAPDDLWFVQLLISKLETDHCFKLCIADRDILTGGAMHHATARLIDERCTRVIIIISSHYTGSDECDWQLKFAHALAPGAMHYNRLLPIVIESNVAMPRILMPIVASDYTKLNRREWFWPKLVSALSAKVGPNSHYLGGGADLPFPVRAPRGLAPPSYHSGDDSSRTPSTSHELTTPPPSAEINRATDGCSRDSFSPLTLTTGSLSSLPPYSVQPLDTNLSDTQSSKRDAFASLRLYLSRLFSKKQ